MKLKTKRKIKRFFARILGLIVVSLALIIAYFNNKIPETLISIVMFYIFRSLFEKQWHARSMYVCACITFVVLCVLIKLELHITISIFYSVVLTFCLTFISYFIKDYNDNIYLIKEYKSKLKSINAKCIENLTLEEMVSALPKVRIDIIKVVYGYLHRNKQINIINYAYNNGVSEATLYRYLKRVKEEYKSLDTKI